MIEVMYKFKIPKEGSMTSRVRSTTLAVLPLAFLFMLTGVNIDANTLEQTKDELQTVTNQESTLELETTVGQ